MATTSGLVFGINAFQNN